MKKSYSFLTANSTIELGRQTLIMAVLNCTPDSFSDGGSYNNVDMALNSALKMIEQGAGLIDIGG